MPRIYELPTHLEVEDQLIAGLTARQLLRLVIGASLAYGVWDQMPWLLQEIRLGLAGALAVTGVAFALLQPHGRSLDGWLLAAALFLVLPRQLARLPALPNNRSHNRIRRAGPTWSSTPSGSRPSRIANW